MRLSNDLREFLESLNSRGVDYVIVGAHSLAFHGLPRYTGDLDILVRPTPENASKLVDLLNPENASKLVDLLNQFGFTDTGFKESDFAESEQMILNVGGYPGMFSDPAAVDLYNATTQQWGDYGVDWGYDANGNPVPYIQLGRPPNRIDLLTSITGVSGDEAFATKLPAELDGIPVFVLSRDALIRNKRAVGRPQDLADLETLEG